MISELDIYRFDLKGYLVLRNALRPSEVTALNACIAAIPSLAKGQWHGAVHAHSFGGYDGLNLQQIYEAGPPFEALIDHPAWIEHVRHFVGGEGTFDYNHGPLFIDENFVNIRGPGEAIGLHSGGHTHTKRTQFHVFNGRFHCGQVNVLLALTDIGPGDGATMIIPGSHKSNFAHPHSASARESVDPLDEAIEIHMRAGDALVFVDALAHGSAKRINSGLRRIAVYRYGPSWGNFRHGYQPSAELLARLTEERRRIVQPLSLIPRSS